MAVFQMLKRCNKLIGDPGSQRQLSGYWCIDKSVTRCLTSWCFEIYRLLSKTGIIDIFPKCLLKRNMKYLFDIEMLIIQHFVSRLIKT